MSNTLKIQPSNTWWDPSGQPLLIAGPCGVESPEQVLSVAGDLSALGIKYLRGGIWKPRTRPDSFQGIGEVGLSWLSDAGHAHGMQVMTEVADPDHLEAALKAGIDMVWIGARTVVNPFQVQRIADALKGVSIPVLVKNPIAPDLELWIGALERMNRSGIDRLAAIHRGFTAYERSHYRNAPNWQIPIELKRRFPELTLFCDPSHIAGKTSMIAPVAQTALDLGYEGLMVEVHPNPLKALSDSEQQLTPAAFEEFIGELVVRSKSMMDAISRSHLAEMRSRIDEFDQLLLDVVAKRMELSREIGTLKKEQNVTIYQLDRWNEILRTRTQYDAASGLTLNKDFIIKFFELIHEESIHQQTQVMNSRDLPGENV